jgi:Domain of unknown function (DUF4190)
MRCTTCDTVLPEGVSFCTNCGARVPASGSAGQPTTSLPAGGFQLPPAPTRPAPQPLPGQTSYPPARSEIPQGSLPNVTYAPATVTSNTAVVSLVFGVLTWVLLPWIGMIIAIIAGHMARREIALSGGRLGGGGMATAGLVLGYLQLALTIGGVCLLFTVFGGLAFLANM